MDDIRFGVGWFFWGSVARFFDDFLETVPWVAEFPENDG